MFDEAIADFTYVLHLDPNYAEAYFNRHLTYLQRGAPGDDRLARRDMDRYRRLQQRRPGNGGG
jgi:lipoprotein NlpI